jgi:ribosomal protein L37AE/L43A
MLKKLQQLNTAYKSYGEIDRHITYTCPKCGKVMDTGFVTAGKGICYRADEEKPLRQFIGPKTLLKNTMNLTMSAKENVAWRCKDCNYILVDHSYLVGKKRTT